MRNKPNDVRVSRELLERVKDDLLRGNGVSRSCLALELNSLLSRPADQQGEPFFYALCGPDGKPYYDDYCVADEAHHLECEEDGVTVVPLYLHAQPATAKVVLPERLDLPHRDEFESADQHAAAVGEAKTWNACLDEVAKLNTPQ